MDRPHAIVRFETLSLIACMFNPVALAKAWSKDATAWLMHKPQGSLTGP